MQYTRSRKVGILQKGEGERGEEENSAHFSDVKLKLWRSPAVAFPRGGSSRCSGRKWGEESVEGIPEIEIFI